MATHYNDDFTAKGGRLVDQPGWINPFASNPARADVSDTLEIVDGVVVKTNDTGDSSGVSDGGTPILYNLNGTSSSKVVIEFSPGAAGPKSFVIGWSEGKCIQIIHQSTNQIGIRRRGFGSGNIGSTFADGERRWRIALDWTAGTIQFRDMGDASLDSGVQQINNGGELLPPTGALFGILPQSDMATGQKVLDYLRIFDGDMSTATPTPSPAPTPTPPSPPPPPTPTLRALTVTPSSFSFANASIGSYVASIANTTVTGTAPPTPPVVNSSIGKHRLATNLQGPAWYFGPHTHVNRAGGAGWQMNRTETRPDGTNFVNRNDVEPGDYAADGTIPQAPLGGIVFTGHPSGNGGVRERFTLWGSADINRVYGPKPGSSSTTGTNPDGSKWIEFTTKDEWDGDYSVVTPDGACSRVHIGENRGSILKITYALASQHDANGQLTGGKFNQAFVDDLAADYSLIRYMDWQNTNGTNGNLHDPAAPEARTEIIFTQNNRPKPTDTIPSYKAWGYSYEDCFDLSAQTNTNAWLCLPWGATREYIRGLLTYGHNALAAGRHIELELTNEIWNNFPVRLRATQYAEARPKPGAGRNWNESDGLTRLFWAIGEKHRELMGYVADWCADNNVTFGKDGRVRRVIAWQHVTPNNCLVLMDAVGDEHWDVFATAPYFGLSAADDPTRNVEVDVIHARMLTDIDVQTTTAAKIADFAKDKGKDYTTYELNTHLASDHLGDYNSFGKQRNVEIHSHPFMREVFSYHVGELLRRVPTCKVYNLFAHVGPVSAQGYFSIKDKLTSTTQESPRYAAWKDLLVGKTTYPSIRIVNSPEGSSEGAISSWTPNVRCGAGFNVPRSITFSDWTLDGQATTPSALNLTVSSTGYTGFAPRGVIGFNVEASDTSGTTGKLQQSFTVIALPSFAFDADYRSSGATEQSASSLGWTGSNVASYAVYNGAMRDKGYGSTSISHSLPNNGVNRRMIVDMDRASDAILRYSLFEAKVALALSGLGNVQLLVNGGHYDHIAPAGTVGAGPVVLDWECVGRVVTIRINGNTLKSVELPGSLALLGDEAVGVHDQSLAEGGEVFRRMRVRAS